MDVPSWFNRLETYPNDKKHTVGVAICVTHLKKQILHIGLLHAHKNQPPQILHLEWHATVKNETISVHTSHTSHTSPFWWVEFPLQTEKVEAIIGFCRRVAFRAKNLKIPFAILYEGGKIKQDGTTELGNKAIGLTCATFVLAILEGVGITLLKLNPWKSHVGDTKWHDYIVYSLNHTPEVTQEHIQTVQNEHGCARYRPEEIVAAVPLSYPVPQPKLSQSAKNIRKILIKSSTNKSSTKPKTSKS